VEVQAKRDSINKFQTQKFQTRKNEEFQALNNEIKRYEGDISTIEDRELELMESGDTAKKTIAETDKETQAVKAQGHQSRRPSININVPSSVAVDVARARLVQALTNVLLNAIESYRDIDSLNPIEVRSDLQEGLVAITVEDSGCGMSAEAQRDALTLFATSKPNGTGVGLPLAAKIIESEHGGRLSIDSVKGRGTIVRIIVPRHRQVDRT